MSDYYYEICSNACACNVCQGTNPSSITVPKGWNSYRTGGRYPSLFFYDPTRIWFKAKTSGKEEDLSQEELSKVCGKIMDSPDGCGAERTYTTWIMTI